MRAVKEVAQESEQSDEQARRWRARNVGYQLAVNLAPKADSYKSCFGIIKILGKQVKGTLTALESVSSQKSWQFIRRIRHEI